MTEKELHREFETYLRARRIPFVTSRMDRRSTIGNGKPDYCVTWMNRCRYIELKTSKGRLSPAQVKEIEYIRRSGNTVEIARTLPEAIEAVRNILCEGKPATDAYGACNYPLEGCFKELKRAVAEVPGNGTENNLNAVPVLAEPREPECSGEARRSIQGSNPGVAAAFNPYEMQRTSNRNEAPNEKGQTNAETIPSSGMQDLRKRTKAVSGQRPIEPKISGQMEGEDSRSQGQNPEAEQMRDMRQSGQSGRASPRLHEAAGSNVAVSNVPRRGVQNFYIGDWKGTRYVFAPDLGGNYKMIRKASVIDIDNLPELP
jgi:hypothetical protein